MNTLNFKYLFSFCLLALFAAPILEGCADSASEKPLNPELINGVWVTRSIRAEPPLPDIGDDIWATKHPCEQDNLYEFRPRGRYTVHQGTNFCDPAIPEPTMGGFSMEVNARTLTLDYDESQIHYDLELLEPKRMVWAYSSSIRGTDYRFTSVFEKVAE